MYRVAVAPRLIVLLAWFFAALQTAYSEMRPWAARGGRPVQAEVVAFDPGTKKATLKRATGTQTVVAFDALIDGDQAYLTEYQRKIDESAAAAKANAGKMVDYKSDPATACYTGSVPAFPATRTWRR